MFGEFENLKIDQDNVYDKGESAESKPTYLTQLAGKDIIQLKSNSFPRGWSPWNNFLTVMMWQKALRWVQEIMKWKSAT